MERKEGGDERSRWDGRAVVGGAVVRWWAGHEIVMNTEGGP